MAWKIYEFESRAAEVPEMMMFASVGMGIYVSLLAGIAIIVNAIWIGALSDYWG